MLIGIVCCFKYVIFTFQYHLRKSVRAFSWSHAIRWKGYKIGNKFTGNEILQRKENSLRFIALRALHIISGFAIKIKERKIRRNSASVFYVLFLRESDNKNSVGC